MSRRSLFEILLPLLLLTAATLLFRLSDLDLRLQDRFYSGGEKWPGEETTAGRVLYSYGTIPSILLGFAGLVVLVAGIWNGRARARRRGAAFLFLVLVIGPGLVVNTTFKEHWGRPRPRDLVRYGGKEEYRKVWTWPGKQGGNSFPSGHAATAFYLFVPYFLLRRNRPGRAAAILAFGIVCGLVMGIARMTQGGHYASDVVWSGGFTWLVAVAMDRLLLPESEEKSKTGRRRV